MARAVARALGLTLAHALKRTLNTRPQHTLDKEARKRNVAGAFVARRKVTGTVLLVDDVVTSGETMRAAADALIKGGAQRVFAIAVARTAKIL
jgi:predicted amidophosphoribosyltransferase